MTNATDNSVFDQTPTPADPANDNNNNASPAPYTSDLVGDGKKFKTVADLESGKVEADAFIERLQSEAETLREDLAKRATVEEALAQLNTGQSSEGNTNPAVDADNLAKLVAEQVSQLDSNKTQTANVRETNDKMVELYGEKAAETVTSKAAELGVTVEFLKSTAATSPMAFYNLIGVQINQQSQNSARTNSSVNTQSLNNGDNSSKDWAYYEEIRKGDSRLYYSPKVQQEMYQAQKNGTLNIQ